MYAIRSYYEVCSPSRASILTGKFAPRHGVTDWIGEASGEAWRKQGRFSKMLPAEYVHSLDTAFVTLPEALVITSYSIHYTKLYEAEKATCRLP